MAVLSATETHSFTPKRYCDEAGDPVEGAPTYEYKPLTILARGKWRAALELRNAFPVSADTLTRLARRVIKTAAPESQNEFLAIVDQWEEITKNPPKDDDPEEEVKRREDAAYAWAGLLDLIREDETIARSLASQARANEYVAVFAFKYGVVGWKNLPVQFKVGKDGVPDDLLDQLPIQDLNEVGTLVLQKMNVSGQERGNLSSPSQSAGGQETSTTS
jgi:hypothetical protein